MSRFAQYYVKYKHDAGCYDWRQRQQAHAQQMRFGVPEMDKDEIIRGQERCDHVLGKAKTSK